MQDGVLLPWLQSKKVVVLLGAGGVGKTTCSITVAFKAALAGAKVGLLSIDPAKRLAAALGISLGRHPKRIPLHNSQLRGEGFIEAAMIDQKGIFDQMVYKHAPNSQTAEKIIAHPIYDAASTKLAGPLEYMALAELQNMIEANRYDLIVLDTPPDTHALEFLSRPNVLEGFMENRVMNWLIKPFHMASRMGVGRILTAGEKLMGGMAKVTGLHALRLVAEFLVLIQQVIDGFHLSGEKILSTLTQKSTGYILVTTPQPMAAAACTNLGKQLIRLGFHLDWIFFNRCLPEHLAKILESYEPYSLGDDGLSVDRLHARYQAEKKVTSDLLSLFEGDKSLLSLSIDETILPIDSETAIWDFANSFG